MTKRHDITQALHSNTGKYIFHKIRQRTYLNHPRFAEELVSIANRTSRPKNEPSINKGDV